MFWFIYHLPLEVVAGAIAVSAPAWALAMWVAGLCPFVKRQPKILFGINLLLADISLGGIIALTLFRTSGASDECILMPFHAFIEAQEQVEMYRSMLMNVALFVPFGLTLPFTLGGWKRHKTTESSIRSVSTPPTTGGNLSYKPAPLCNYQENKPNSLGSPIRNPAAKTILFAFILSVIIEALQLIFGLGRCETDDVLCNTLGAAIGSLSFLISEKLTRCHKNTKNKTE